MRKFILFLLLGGVSFACKKSEAVANPPVVVPPVTTGPIERVNGTTPGTNLTDREFNLQVVYFVPKDLEVIKGYETRLSELMLWGQQWYKEKMAIYGYDKTFGMYTDAAKKSVRITTVYGTKTSAEYTAEGGAAPIWKEIEAYFSANPALRTSDHFINIVPRYSFKANGEPTGPPYHGATYGKNRTCFVLDYEDQDLKYMADKTDKGKWFRLYYGGLLHELGHALNLPHNMQTTAELADPNKGSGMMHIGNYTLGSSPTFLTPFDCALLNDNQVMNKNKNTYYGSVTASITDLQGTYNAVKGAIVLSGKFSSNTPVNNIGILNDPNVNNEGLGTNKDYNALAYAVKPGQNNDFYIEMPVTDFTYRSNEEYELRIFLVHNNGTLTLKSYAYKFVNNIPVIDFSTRPEIAKDGWVVSDFSSEETAAEGRAKAVIDGSLLSFWHSRWSSNSASYPHYLTIDLSASKTTNGLSLTHREGGSRAIKDFELLTSSDGVTFNSLGNKVAANSSGTQYFNFDSPKTFRYFKVICKSSWDGTQNAALAELGLY
ncbi:F5/8 type C domain-containing protein [Pedobacter steynii]|uniref:F5/8 type C domain-containing protein n=1 Tax=Pedobacter steynii TaxID=430522 RepID=A0A1G9JCU4_9SPHI|nr:discoidin domain-containing protein [Pedobacter steynii]NQX38213.1 discoidin domain-containing protein [Pedobacter steynii]SDL35248.1 F5/8 type C domain-containing protein [Pedobacter steynii]